MVSMLRRHHPIQMNPVLKEQLIPKDLMTLKSKGSKRLLGFGRSSRRPYLSQVRWVSGIWSSIVGLAVRGPAACDGLLAVEFDQIVHRDHAWLQP